MTPTKGSQPRKHLVLPLLLTALLLTPGATYAAPTLEAKLVDAENKAKKQTATVQVTVGEIRLVDPDAAVSGNKVDEGHLHYQVDKGPVIATTATKLSFHALTVGQHSLVVTLVGNDHNPVGSQQTITFAIP